MNKVERLADLFGSQTELAGVMGVDRAVVARLVKMDGDRAGYGIMPTRYNQRIVDGAAARGLLLQVEPLLEPNVCPCCGARLEPGQVVRG